MRRYQIIPLILVGVISAGSGAAAGYAFGSDNAFGLTNQKPIAEAAGLPVHHLAATSPSALQREMLEPDIPGPLYLLGTDHGFVAIFYINNDSPILKERTQTPESILSPEEQKRLANGIYIYTEEQLVRALQDYGS